MKLRTLLVIAAAGISTACIGPVFGDSAFADSCDHNRDFEEVIAADGARKVTVDALAGNLRITGLAGAEQVIARGDACAGSEGRLEEISLDISRRGDTIAVKVIIPETRGWSKRDQARMDLTVTLPAALAVLADDGSGDLEVEGVESLVLDDGSGNIRIANIGGEVEIDDGSGNIDVDGIDGGIRINDGSGNIELRSIGGTVVLDDGSGNIEVADAAEVVVREDGSGDMMLRDVRGDVRVEEDGSGSIRVRGVGGDFTVERDGSGGIDVTDVRGRISTPDD